MDREALRLAASLFVVGEILSLLVGILHPARENPNNHPAVFAEYAASQNWTAVHLGQFVGMTALIAGLLVLFGALGVREGTLGWVNRIGAVTAGVALGLYGVLQAVDGVALKQAVDAWSSAPAAEKPARFAAAETMRWLEWGVRSYQSVTLGIALVLLAVVIIWTARLPRAMGYLICASGAAYLAQGWVLGSQGFSAAGTVPQLLGYLFILAWSIWLLLMTWRMKQEARQRATPAAVARMP